MQSELFNLMVVRPKSFRLDMVVISKTLGSGKHTRRKLLFFVFSEVKNVILLYIKLEKTEISLFSSLSFFDLGDKEIFLLLQILWKAKKTLG